MLVPAMPTLAVAWLLLELLTLQNRVAWLV